MTINVSKVSVATGQKDLWQITLNMTCIEDSTEVINQDFTQKYRTGQSIGDLTTRFDRDMQKVINDYNSSQAIFDNAQLDTIVSWLNNNLSG